MANPQPYPSRRYTVKELTDNRSLLDITPLVRKDPQRSYAVASGAGGDVYKAKYKVFNPDTNLEYDLNVAVKILRGSPDQKEMIERRLNREIACWRRLKHPHVAELLGIAYLIPDLPPGLVSKWVLRYDFLKFIGSHPDLKRDKAKEIVSGLQYMHEQGVVHGDLKVDNVIVSDRKEAQITDFGIGHILDVKGFTTMTERNIRFTAPELMPMGEDIIRPTSQSDIFSLGILLLQLFHGPDDNKQRGMPYNHVRFNPYPDIGLMTRILDGERPQRERYNFIEDRHWELMCKCWMAKPDERPSVTAVQEEL